MVAVSIVGALFVWDTARADSWDATEKTLAGAALIGTAIDWRQTQIIAATPGCWEKNPLIGAHPSMKRVNLYFIGAIGVNYLVADALPSGWRKAWLGSVTALEIVMVGNNKRMGIGFKF